jgi:hypothetical protein
MNPYLILGIVLVIGAAGIGGCNYGHDTGINEQKAADQAQFDKLNSDIANQKIQANAVYRNAQDANLALMIERDQFKTRLEKEHANNQAATTALRDKYFGIGLRFTAEPTARLGSGGGSTKGAEINPAGDEPASLVQLPGEIAANLRRLAFDADQLADDYRKCYGYATQVR